MSLRTGLLLIVGAIILFVIVGMVWKPGPPAATAVPGILLEYKPPRGYVCYRARTPINIDGKLDDEAWRDLPWSEDFVDIEGSIRPLPMYRTRIKMAWDENALYIAAELEEPHVIATLTKHDSYIFHNDHDFEVFLDPDGDSHVYVELEMNARNTTWDLLLVRPYSAGGPALDAFEITGLRTAVHVDGTLNDAKDRDRGWTLEIAWPWASLQQLAKRKMPPQPGEQFRINFSRVELDYYAVDGAYRRLGRPESNWVWSPQGVVDMHRPETWGYLQFSDAKPGEDKFRPDPTGPARSVLSRIYHEQGAYHRKHSRYAAALSDLDLAGLTHETLTGPPRLECTGHSFEATATLKDGP